MRYLRGFDLKCNGGWEEGERERGRREERRLRHIKREERSEVRRQGSVWGEKGGVGENGPRRLLGESEEGVDGLDLLPGSHVPPVRNEGVYGGGWWTGKEENEEE